MERRQQFVKRLWQVADIAAPAAATATWWFVLRSDARVVDAVDSISYLITAFSLWRAIRSLALRYGSERIGARRREVTETGEQRCVAAEVGGKTPEGVSQDVVAGGEQGGGPHRAEIGQATAVGGRHDRVIRRRIRIVFHRAPR